MPYYDLKCRKCGAVHQDVFSRIAHVGDVVCHLCHGATDVLISRIFTHCDIEEYLDENLASAEDGKPVHVKSKKHKRKLLKERGLFEKPDKHARWV